MRFFPANIFAEKSTMAQKEKTMTKSLRSRSIRVAVLAAALSTVGVGAHAGSDVGWAVGAGVALGLLAGGPTYVQTYPQVYPAPVYNTVPVQPVYQGQIYSQPLYSNMPPQVTYGSTYYDQPYVAPRPVYVQPPPVYYAPPAVIINGNRGYYNDRPYRGNGDWRNDGYRHHDHRR